MQGRNSVQQDIDVDLGRLAAGLASRWRLIVAVALGLTVLAWVAASIATPHYKAEARILIEARESVFTRPGSTQEADRPLLDEEGVLSQVQVISSTDLLKQVARDLDLASRAEFEAGGNLGALSRAFVLLGLRSDPSGIPPEERVLRKFREKLTVYRVERSRVIVIEFSSVDPALAAAVPNAIAGAYLEVQREAKLVSNTDATDWLEPEIADLRERVREAEAKVAEFRSRSDLLIGQNNSVLATQQLSELSTELSRVRAERAAAEARAEGVRTALAAGASAEALPEVLSSTLIQRLRERQVQLQADIADLSATLLDNHPRLRSLRSQLADLDTQIRSEARKVLAGLETEARTAALRERQLTGDLNTLKAASARAGEEEVDLRALEREATAQRELLESYLARYREAMSRRERNYVPVDARVISSAVTPNEPYFPKKLPIAGATFAGSLLLMALAVLLQELFSGRAMRPAPTARPEEVEDVAMPVTEPVSADPVSEAGLDVAAAAEGLIAGGASRAVFVSPEGDEAAAASILVAREIADSGLRVLLLDMTLSGAASAPMLDGLKRPGITDLLASEAQFSEIIHEDRYSECHVIPSGLADPRRAMRAAERLPIILRALETAYDIVVIECGPADADAIGRLVGEDTEVLVSALEAGQADLAPVLADLAEGGFETVSLVELSGAAPMPTPPVSDRSAA